MLNIKGHADKSHDADLLKLTNTMKKMGELVVQLLDMAKVGITSHGKDLREEAKALDKEINRLDIDIEIQAMTIMSRRQLFMDELRLMTSSLKISTSLERMGDMAKNTVKRAAKLAEPLPPNTLNELLRMIDITKAMIHELLDMFVKFDEKRTEAIWARDDEIDETYKRLFEKLQKDMSENPEKVKLFTHIIFAAKNLERMGDHVTSLARVLYYINKGEMKTKVGNEGSGK